MKQVEHIHLYRHSGSLGRVRAADVHPSLGPGVAGSLAFERDDLAVRDEIHLGVVLEKVDQLRVVVADRETVP